MSKVEQLAVAQNQDVEDGLRWWAEASNEEKIKVWGHIQECMDKKDVIAVIARFAQVGFTLEAERRKIVGNN